MIRLTVLSLVYLVAGFGTLILLLAGRRRALPSGLSGLAAILLWPLALPFAFVEFAAQRPRDRRDIPVTPSRQAVTNPVPDLLRHHP